MKTSLYIALATICAYQFEAKAAAPKIEENNFGDLVITLEKEHSTEEVSQCIDQHGKPDKPIFIHIPNNDLIEQLIAQGFCEFHSNNEKRILIRRVGEDDAPSEPFTCNAGAKVLITREQDGELQMLLTKERRENGKIYFLLPGGMSKREKTLTTAIRELREEIGMETTHEKLALLGILQKLYGGHGAMHHLYIYHKKYEGEKIAPDGKEVLDILWVPVKKVLAEGKASGTPVSPERLQILHDISNGKQGTPCVHIPDPSKKQVPEINKDDNRVMDFYSATR